MDIRPSYWLVYSMVDGLSFLHFGACKVAKLREAAINRLTSERQGDSGRYT